MTFACIKYFHNSALLSEETLLELLKNVTYIKKISMNSYFFFGFHTFKDFTVTFMCHLNVKNGLNWIIKLALKSYFSKSDREVKVCLKKCILNVFYLNFFN